MTRSGTISAITLILATLALPATASAAEGWARSSGILRAGPQSDYPAITRVAGGQALDVFGCLAGRDWCDVGVDGERGWFPGSRIELLGDGRRIRVSDPAAAVIGLSILSFGMAEYWRSHYEDRPFYRNDRYWRGHGSRPPPRGAATAPRPGAPAMRPPRGPARNHVVPARPTDAASPRSPRADAPARPRRPEVRAPIRHPAATPTRAGPQRVERRPQPSRVQAPHAQPSRARPHPAAPARPAPHPGCAGPARCR